MIDRNKNSSVQLGNSDPYIRPHFEKRGPTRCQHLEFTLFCLQLALQLNVLTPSPDTGDLNITTLNTLNRPST